MSLDIKKLNEIVNNDDIIIDRDRLSNRPRGNLRTDGAQYLQNA